ncbi:MAG: glucose-1-phosphate adenylyltransferase subunit GlgD [Clostridia bacterium]|nr:glucose-1-phosphate adenylyltransferase subunit GlgD [Clostridia bacterium]
MRTSAVAGIVFANVNDNLLKKLTTKRSMASVPFGGRYRLIDFALSNLVNAGVTNVGIITKENYRSLMDHVGNGIYWDLDRKNGGLYVLPPYSTGGAKRYSGTVDALAGAKDYIKHCNSDYIVICNADVLANVDVSSAIKAHIKNEADITVVYHKGTVFANSGETMLLGLKGDRVTSVDFDSEGGAEAAFSIGITIVGRELLLRLVEGASEEEYTSFNREVIAKKIKQLKVCGFEHSEYVAFMNGTDSYFRASMDLLDADVRRQLFNSERPVFTKTRDDMPTRYGTKAIVNNCFIADGCVIEGTVKNSVLFRGVKVEKGAVVENCILMQETKVGKETQLNNVISDKNAAIGDNMVLKGTAAKKFFIKKNQVL